MDIDMQRLHDPIQIPVQVLRYWYDYFIMQCNAVQVIFSAYVRDIYTIRSSGQKLQIVIFIYLSCMFTVVD